MVHIRLKELEEYAKKNKIPIMQKEGIDFLTNYIKKNNITNILEIGSAIGYSAIKMALIDKNIKITTIEKDENRYKEAINNIKKFKLENQITIIHDDALNIELNEKFDLLFIDAAKGKYIDFFNKFDSNLLKGSTVVSDNLSFHGFVEDETKTKNRNTKQLVRKIKKYIEFLKNNKNYETSFYSLGDGVSVSIKKN